MRPAHRTPLPDLERALREANQLLAEAGLPRCESLAPVADLDTANPTLIGHCDGPRYAVKVVQRHPRTLAAQLEIANFVRERTRLPIPRHLAHAPDAADRLPLLIMEWLPGEQLRTLLPSAAPDDARELTRDWGRCLAELHAAPRPPALDPVPRNPGPARGWLREVASRGAAELRARGWPATRAEAALRFLDERLERPGPPRPALTTDQDVRDFLGTLAPRPRVSAMLDWERVAVGDAYYDLAVLYLRHRILGLDATWPAFRAGYEAASGGAIEPSERYACYLLARALLGGARFPELAADLVARLVSGEVPGLRSPDAAPRSAPT